MAEAIVGTMTKMISWTQL